MGSRGIGRGRAGRRRTALLATLGLVLGGLGGAGSAGVARADGGVFDPSFGDGGGVALDWTVGGDTTLVGTNGVVGAAAGDRFGVTAAEATSTPLGNTSGRSMIGFAGAPAVAKGMSEDGLIVGSAGDDFGSSTSAAPAWPTSASPATAR